MAARPLQHLRIDALERFFESDPNNIGRLRELEDELARRRMPRATALKAVVTNQIEKVEAERVNSHRDETPEAMGDLYENELETAPTKPIAAQDFRPWYERRIRAVVATLISLAAFGMYVGGAFEGTFNKPGDPLEASGKPSDFQEQPQKSARQTPARAESPTKSEEPKPQTPEKKIAEEAPKAVRVEPPTKRDEPKRQPTTSKPDGSNGNSSALNRKGDEPPKLDFITEEVIYIGPALVAAVGLGVNESVRWQNRQNGRHGLVTVLGPSTTKRNCYVARVSRHDVTPWDLRTTEFCP